MKIAIAGTRGIPNNYGGFEQCAEFLSVRLAQRGHEVTVYSTHYHPYQENKFEGVTIRHCYNPENKIGTPGNFIYDYLCMRDAVKNNFDVLLVLGYTTASVFYPYMNFRKTALITNMDGLEWKRDKWNPVVKKMAKYFEKLGAMHSQHLVSDNEKIREYILKTYNRDSDFIAYGCMPFESPDESVLKEYKVEKGKYGILIARMEAENNIEMILQGFVASKQDCKLLVVGNPVTKYGIRMKETYGTDSRVVFTGGIYNLNHLNNLRYYSKFYFHGHSVGGTNPSLLEAMASSAYIIAHGNEFNKAILGDDALYFNDHGSLSKLLNNYIYADEMRKNGVVRNLEKVKNIYNWEHITNLYENLFKRIVKQ